MKDCKKSPHYLVRPSTAIISRGFDPSLSVGSARPAVFRSSTYVFSSPEKAERAFSVALGRVKADEGEDVELIYSRLSHPNAEILETHLVPLEPQAQSAAVFNSGLAALSTVFFTFCTPGGTIIYTSPVYGGTYHLLRKIMAPLGIQSIAVPAGDHEALSKAMKDCPKIQMVFLETPANPTLVMSDIRGAVSLAHKHPDKPLVMVDNTFMGPAFQHPLVLGADLVAYSATKFLSGFSDMLGGVVLGKDACQIALLAGTRAMLGNILQPDGCWMLDSRLPTVKLRMNKQSKNATQIAHMLARHKKVGDVLYPGLYRDSEQIRIRDSQCRFPGSIIAFRVRGGKKEAFDFLRYLNLPKNAVSLGGMETLVCHPATTTHSEMETSELSEHGIDDSLVRISVGIEDWRDISADLEQALNRI